MGHCLQIHPRENVQGMQLPDFEKKEMKKMEPAWKHTFFSPLSDPYIKIVSGECRSAATAAASRCHVVAA